MLPKQVSFANVIALVALFIALGSGVWAAQQSPQPEQAEAPEEATERAAAPEPRADELGLPTATGRVRPDGRLEAGARGMKADKVRRIREGTYCVSIRANVPLITAGLSEEDQAEAEVLLMTAAQARRVLDRSLSELGCPRPHRWVVQTRNSRGVLDDSWFYLALFD